jgi:hypothetical protein
MTKEEIAKCKVGDEVEYNPSSTNCLSEFYALRGRVGVIYRTGRSSPMIEIPGERPDGLKVFSTRWEYLKYIDKKQRQLTFTFTE